jgi:hypothetical protein
MPDAHIQKISKWADPVVERLFALLDNVRVEHPEVKIHEMIELIGEVATQVLSVYGDPDYLREENWDVFEEEMPAVRDQADLIADEIGQLPLW